VAQVEASLQAALADIRQDPERGLASRLGAPHRKASAKVREVLAQQW
jgi:malonate decarboxylase gamma subunit